MVKKLYRSQTDRKIAGVCAGVAKYLGVDVTVIRAIWAVTTVFAFAGAVAYAVCVVLIPEDPGYIDA